MNGDRSLIFEWAVRGVLPLVQVPDALRVARVTPDAAQWRHFSIGCCSASVSCRCRRSRLLVALNWQSLGRYAKFALAEVPIAVAMGVCWRYRIESSVGKAALVAAALLTGALLALVGQVYQTGADTFELFAAWALAIAVWVAVARLPALWLLWLAIVNVALALYVSTWGTVFGGMLGVMVDVAFGPRSTLWLLFALDAAALVVWEVLAERGVEWLRERWAVRVVATASGVAVTALAVMAVFDRRRADVWACAAYVAWLAGIYYAYRRRSRDLFMLAGAVTSAIVVITVALADRLLPHGDAAGYLVTGLVIVALGTAGAWWLRSVSAEDEA